MQPSDDEMTTCPEGQQPLQDDAFNNEIARDSELQIYNNNVREIMKFLYVITIDEQSVLL